jgi:hypothetical protein
MSTVEDSADRPAMGTQTELEELIADTFVVDEVLGERCVESGNENKQNSVVSYIR